MKWPGGCWFFKVRLTYSASDFLSRHSFRLPFPANLFSIPLHGPSSPYSPPPESLSSERWGWTCFNASVAFSFDPFSSDIVSYSLCNTRRARKLFVFVLTKQVPYTIHVQLVRSLTAHGVSSIYTSNPQLPHEYSHLPYDTQFIPTLYIQKQATVYFKTIPS
jgi:hypothetical protein